MPYPCDDPKCEYCKRMDRFYEDVHPGEKAVTPRRKVAWAALGITCGHVIYLALTGHWDTVIHVAFVQYTLLAYLWWVL